MKSHPRTISGTLPPTHSPRWSIRRGVTLVEMLVAMTVSLIMIFALVQVFELLGDSVASGRAIIELSGQLRSTVARLEQDLEGLTVPVLPWPRTSAGAGYLEYLEGPGSDADPRNGTNIVLPGTTTLITTWGDWDDVLMFTSRSAGEPFIGQVQGTTIQSQLAEIAYWTRWVDADGNSQPDPGELTLYRRALLIRPNLNGSGGFVDSRTEPNTQPGLANLRTFVETFYNNNDISVHPVVRVDSMTGNVTVALVANSLTDLTKRENRFAHYPVIFENPPGTLILQPNAALTHAAGFPSPVYPFPIDRDPRSTPSLYRLIQSGDQQGEDVMLSQLLAFDVKAYDPAAPISTDDANVNLRTEALVPGDPGYDLTRMVPAHPNYNAALTIGYGAYVDLAYGYDPPSIFASNLSVFSGPPAFFDANGNRFKEPAESFRGLFDRTYDTWSLHYEHNGVDEDQDSATDEGTNGFDDDGVNGVDDVGERETAPPYAVPLRGIKISVRIIENDTRQVKQASSVVDFIPE